MYIVHIVYELCTFHQISVHAVYRSLLAITFLWSLECFHLGKADLQSLDFTFNRFCMKLFKSGNIELVKDYQRYYGIDLSGSILTKR